MLGFILRIEEDSSAQRVQIRYQHSGSRVWEKSIDSHPQSFKDFIYLLLEREGRKTLMCGCLLCVPHWGPGPQARHVP